MVNEVNRPAEHCMLLLHLLLQNCLLLLLLKLQELHRLTAVADAARPIVAMAVAIDFFFLLMRKGRKGKRLLIWPPLQM